MPKFERDKGKRGERLVVNALKEFFGEDIGRDLNDVYKKRGIDLLGTEPFVIQVKHYKNHVSLTKYKEIKSNEGEIALLVSWPSNRKDKPMVVMSLDDFKTLLPSILGDSDG